jgi:hypothetical protein
LFLEERFLENIDKLYELAAIVHSMEAERKLVEANRKLSEIWGEETIDSNRADRKTGDKHG